MKLQRKTLTAWMIVVLLMISAVAFTTPGKHAASSIISMLRGSSALTAPIPPDVEQRARTRHGWMTPPLNSVAAGAITFYDREGTIIDQANLRVYRGYPIRLRIELDRRGQVETLGFDGTNPWRAGMTTLPDQRARDIRSWLRVSLERLFITRALGASYREAGPRVESSKPAKPWQDQVSINPPVAYEQVEMDDTAGPPPGGGRVGDRRFVYYYVNRQDGTIESVRWLEPDNPSQAITDQSAPKLDIRVDFADWRTVSGLVWPFEVVHWTGGKVDYRVVVNQVQINQPLSDTIFQNPAG